MNKLCKDNVMCCDDNCKRCANLVYEAYLKLKNKQTTDEENKIGKPDTCRCLREKDKEEYWGFWFDCECGYKLNTEQAVYCGGCGKKINVIGTIGDKAEF